MSMFGHLTVSAICIILIVIDCHRQHKQTYMDHHHHHLISHLENCIQRLPISHRINFKLATFGYKIQSTSQPTYLHQLIPRQFTGSSMSLRSSQKPLLQVPRTRTAYGSRAFNVTVFRTYGTNYPPMFSPWIVWIVFRRRLKTHLFTADFGDK